MSNMKQDEYKFPDEVENETSPESELEFEIEDDTPPEDRNRKPPLPKEMIEEIENDELESYSEEVKSRINKLKKIYHDERREKDAALREQQEALAYAQRILEENKQLKSKLSTGEKTFVDTYRTAAELELEKAKREYKDAHDMGDTDLIIAAQENLTSAQYKLQKVKEYVPSLQQEEVEVQPQQIPTARPDQRAAAWQERNQWFGQDEEMTSLALGLHQKLVSQYGAAYPSTDEYWKKVDDTMRRRFPEHFADREEVEVQDARIQREKPAQVVAPATRTTGSKKVVVKKSAVAMAKKLGVPLEKYVQEMQKLEARNG